MSDIKIRNMAMPEGCFFCPLMVKKDADFYKCVLAGFKYPIGYYYEHATNERNPLCPLEPLPDSEADLRKDEEGRPSKDCPWK